MNENLRGKSKTATAYPYAGIFLMRSVAASSRSSIGPSIVLGDASDGGGTPFAINRWKTLNQARLPFIGRMYTVGP